jgi:hypothetical protein
MFTTPSTTRPRTRSATARRSSESTRRRVAAGAAVIALAGVGGVISYSAAHADTAATNPPAELVTITPCRLVDTRPGGEQVGPRASPLGADETVSFAVRGSNGRCAIPPSATGIVSNVTAVDPTASSYVTVYPGDVDRPLASNLNFAPDSAATPNQVTVGLSPAGDIRVYNAAGRVDIVIDIVGYFQPASNSGGSGNVPGPQGLQGPQGPQGESGLSGHEVVFAFRYPTPGGLLESINVECPAGKMVLSGGVQKYSRDLNVLTSTPLDDGITWHVVLQTYSGNPFQAGMLPVNVRVVCATVNP